MDPAVVFRAILCQEHDNGNRISYVEHVTRDSRTVKKACGIGFSGPLLNVTVGVFRFEIKVGVRIDPVNPRDYTRHCGLVVDLEFGLNRVVCNRGKRRQQQCNAAEQDPLQITVRGHSPPLWL